jgi:hypothetical protein
MSSVNILNLVEKIKNFQIRDVNVEKKYIEVTVVGALKVVLNVIVMIIKIYMVYLE